MHLWTLNQLLTRVSNRDPYVRRKATQCKLFEDDRNRLKKRRRSRASTRCKTRPSRIARRRVSLFFKDRYPIHLVCVPFPLVITDANSVFERLGTATNWSFNSTTLASASYYFPFLRQCPYLFTQIASTSANLFT